MGGPAASVLLREPLSSLQIQDLRHWIFSLGEPDHDPDKPTGPLIWNVYFVWPPLPRRAVARRDLNPFLIEVQDLDPTAELVGASGADPDDFRRLTRLLGWTPAQEVFVSAWCSGTPNHLLTAWLCAELAERFQGLIDTGGTLRLPAENVREREGLSVGVLLEDHSITWDGRPFTRHLVDALFLRAWMKHSDFHMVR